MKVTILIIVSSIVIFAAAFGYDMYGSPQFVPAPTPDEDSKEVAADISLGLVPDFSLETIDGRKASISDFRGKVVIVGFWATWCSTCVIEMPDMLKLTYSYGGKVVFLAISSDSKIEHINRFISSSNEAVRALFSSSNVYVSLDKNGAITYDKFMTERFPETIIVAPNGDMVRKIVGEFEWGGNEIKQYIDDLL